MGSQLWGVVIGGAIAGSVALASAWLNNRLAVQREKAARAHDLTKERFRWAREHNIPIYAEIMRLGRLLADEQFNTDLETERLRGFRTALYQLKIVASPQVRKIAEEYETYLLRYRLTARQMRKGPGAFNDNEAAYATWEDAERRLYEAIYRERGDEG